MLVNALAHAPKTISGRAPTTSTDAGMPQRHPEGALLASHMELILHSTLCTGGTQLDLW